MYSVSGTACGTAQLIFQGIARVPAGDPHEGTECRARKGFRPVRYPFLVWAARPFRRPCLAPLPAGLAPVEPEAPGVNCVDDQMRLAPRIPSKNVSNRLFRIGLDCEHDADIIEQSTQDDDPRVHKLIHVVGVLTPLRLLAHRLREVPLGAGVPKQYEEHQRQGISGRESGVVRRREACTSGGVVPHDDRPTATSRSHRTPLDHRCEVIGERDGRTNSRWSLWRVQSDSVGLHLLGGVRSKRLWGSVCVSLDPVGGSRCLLQLRRPERIRHHTCNGGGNCPVAELSASRQLGFRRPRFLVSPQTGGSDRWNYPSNTRPLTAANLGVCQRSGQKRPATYPSRCAGTWRWRPTASSGGAKPDHQSQWR